VAPIRTDNLVSRRFEAGSVDLRLKTPFIPSLNFTPTLPSACHCGLPHQIRNPSLRLAAHVSARCSVERRLSRSCKVCLLAIPDVHGNVYLAFSFVLVRLALLPHALSSALFTASCSTHSLFKHLRIASTLRLALRAPPRRAPGPPIMHPLRRASISRTSVPAAAAASTLALAPTAAPMSTIVEPLPHGEAPLLPRRCMSTLSAPPPVGTSPHPRGPHFWWCSLRHYLPPTLLSHLPRDHHPHRR
jgi:hypothetical protein